MVDELVDARSLEVAHELRGPLTVVSLSAQLMLRRRAYDERALRYIVGATERLLRLVGDLVPASPARADGHVLRPASVDLVAVAGASVESARVLTTAHRLRLEAPANPVVGWWDRDRVEQVLTNLVGNAIKHTPGGEIVVRVESWGAEARVAVQDQGPGIPAEALPHLFERFYRAIPTADGPPGHGLGLYLSKSLVEAHGGRLWVESSPGLGSTFIFELPRHPPAWPHAADDDQRSGAE